MSNPTFGTPAFVLEPDLLPVYEANTKGIPYLSFVPEVRMYDTLHRVSGHIGRRQGQKSLINYKGVRILYTIRRITF